MNCSTNDLHDVRIHINNSFIIINELIYFILFGIWSEHLLTLLAAHLPASYRIVLCFLLMYSVIYTVWSLYIFLLRGNYWIILIMKITLNTYKTKYTHFEIYVCHNILSRLVFPFKVVRYIFLAVSFLFQRFYNLTRVYY